MVEFTLPTLLNPHSKLRIKEQYVELERPGELTKKKFRMENIASVQIRRSPLFTATVDQFAVPLSGMLILATLIVTLTGLASSLTEMLPGFVTPLLVGLSVVAVAHIALTVLVGYLAAQIVISTQEGDISIRTRKSECKQIFDRL